LKCFYQAQIPDTKQFLVVFLFGLTKRSASLLDDFLVCHGASKLRHRRVVSLTMLLLHQAAADVQGFAACLSTKSTQFFIVVQSLKRSETCGYLQLRLNCNWARSLPAQGMILIADPAYNEPNVEQMRATAEGEARSRLYNAEVLTLG